MFGIGMMELTVILVIALLVFGPKKLPEIGKGLGQGIREFKKAGQEFAQSLDQEASADKKSHIEDKSNTYSSSSDSTTDKDSNQQDPDKSA